MKYIAVLGSTGSIGQNTLKVARHLPELIQVKALGAHSNIDLLEEQINEFHPLIVAVYDETKACELKRRMPHVNIVSGKEGMEEAASHSSVNFVIMAIVGTDALAPTLRAIESGKGIGLANKEVLVSAGNLVTQLAHKKGVVLIPIDSEHSAIFQCLEGRNIQDVNRLVLTASGGPFRHSTEEELASITPEKALAHPTWSMGPKVTIDCSTLLNKGLEMIEAHFLFNIPSTQIEVVIHPQSIIHSMVEFIDGSILAQMSEPHMIYPIQYALTYPGRKKGLFQPFDFLKNSKLEFYPPNFKKFPALNLAYDALKGGKSFPCYLNAANEILVKRFLKKEISWQGITNRLESLLSRHEAIHCDSLESILFVDQMARDQAKKV